MQGLQGLHAESNRTRRGCGEGQGGRRAMDVARRDTVDVELNRPIEKRSPRETDPDERDELWKASVAAYNARRREENRLAWWRVPPRPGGAPQDHSRGPDCRTPG